MQDMNTKFSKAVATFLIASAEFTRPTFAEYLAAHSPTEPTLPEGHIECLRCDGTGEVIQGFCGYSPNQERCPRCDGFGFHEQRAIDADKATHEATLPDYVALSHAAVAVGHEPY